MIVSPDEECKVTVRMVEHISTSHGGFFMTHRSDNVDAVHLESIHEGGA